jgi:hypothetical protein
MAQIVLHSRGVLMLGRKILQSFSALGLLLGVSCALNPQPEPPGGPLGNDNTSGTTTGGGVPGVSIDSDAGAQGSGPNDNTEAGAELQDSSISSDGSGPETGPADASSDADDAAAESSADAGADAPPEGATTVD